MLSRPKMRDRLNFMLWRLPSLETPAINFPRTVLRDVLVHDHGAT